MRTSERISGKIISPTDLRAKKYNRKTSGHYITEESRQLPELVDGVQRAIMAKLRKVEELGFDIDKSFVNSEDQIDYNNQIDAALIEAGWEA